MEKIKTFTKDIIDINSDTFLSFVDCFAKFTGTEKNTYTEGVKTFIGSVRENAKQVIEGKYLQTSKE